MRVLRRTGTTEIRRLFGRKVNRCENLSSSEQTGMIRASTTSSPVFMVDVRMWRRLAAPKWSFWAISSAEVNPTSLVKQRWWLSIIL